MKLIAILLLLLSSNVFAQKNPEFEIKRLEQNEVKGILSSDTSSLLKIWHPAFVCNNPYGVIVTIPEILGFIRKGQIDYSSMERIVERVTITDNVAISMGTENLSPQKGTPYAGNVLHYRYTHTWLKGKSGWQLLARQASDFPLKK